MLQSLPSYTVACPDDVATQKLVEGQDTESNVPPAPTGWGADHRPLRHASAFPASSTAMHIWVLGQETP
ncbi:MAG TPA: hypothetical protein VEH82_06955 [Acidimicrobiales bacterium]|nr:hypothetical protein [Acidimicrobiales bacterium]